MSMWPTTQIGGWYQLQTWFWQECERIDGIVRQPIEECERIDGIVRQPMEECERIGVVIQQTTEEYRS